MSPAAVTLAVLGHVVPFEFLQPSGAGNRPEDGGAYDVVWHDANAGGGTADIFLTAVRPSWVPWERAAVGAEVNLNFVELAVSSPVDVFTWQTTGTPAGCWQPVARVQDPTEGIVTYAAPGLITVGDGPSIWIEAIEVDAGTAQVRLQLSGGGELSFEARAPNGPAIALPSTPSGVLDTRALDAGTPYYLHAFADAGSGWCDVWSVQPFTPAAPEHEADPMKPDEPPRGCGCGATGPLLLIAALALITRAPARRPLLEPEGNDLARASALGGTRASRRSRTAPPVRACPRSR